ncbi:hypothetical protein NQ317_015661 [Molorchus minor]|uniref:DUF5641 domain-containing protein n=1 Tax=Molorchus minor TaxID=1323400 RepID=A0ABQ9JKL1_9CUCU|nr:hypothetical protein NQ317_015661 [Molorchus minor]
MYLQIQLQPAHRDYHRILWRFSPDEPLREYRLNTVTVGISSSPFLAIRTLRELANLESQTYPEASRLLLNDTYVDDKNSIDILLENISSLSKIQRIISYCLRIPYNFRNRSTRRVEAISSVEILQLVLVKHVQHIEFSDILIKLRRNQLLPKPFRKLALFVDNQDLIRVGGRLRNSELGFDEKLPLLLPRSHRLTELLIEHAYLCIFVCCNTKAIYIELASDLSSEAFIACFRRLISRRGRCDHLYSDCEYLNTLQQRAKWTSIPDNIKLNTLVLIKNELKPSLQWGVGRIVELHPGKDGHIRVVSPKQKKPAGLLAPHRVVDRPFQMVSCDLIGPLPRSMRGFKYILVIVETFRGTFNPLETKY